MMSVALVFFGLVFFWLSVLSSQDTWITWTGFDFHPVDVGQALLLETVAQQV